MWFFLIVWIFLWIVIIVVMKWLSFFCDFDLVGLIISVFGIGKFIVGVWKL